VVPGGAIGRLHAEVVRHQVHEVDRALYRVHVGVRQERREGAGGHREQQLPGGRDALGVETRAQRRHQLGEVRRVFGSMGIRVTGQGRVLPVDIDPVEGVAANERHGAVDKTTATVGGQRRIREPL
jgi:hypothetical protein